MMSLSTFLKLILKETGMQLEEIEKNCLLKISALILTKIN